MKTKIKKVMSVVYAIIAAIILVGAFVFLGVFCAKTSFAYAEEIDGEVEVSAPNVEETQPEEDDNFSEVFKNDILPLIIGAGEGILGILIVLVPYIKIRGKNKSLIGMLSATKESLKQYQELADKFTVDSFIQALQSDVIESLKSYIAEIVNKTVKDNFVDNTDGLTELKATTEIISAQLNNFIKAASIVWKEADGATELLAKSPTSEVLKGLLGQVADLRKKVEEKQATELAEVDAVVKELEVYNVDE